LFAEKHGFNAFFISGKDFFGDVEVENWSKFVGELLDNAGCVNQQCGKFHVVFLFKGQFLELADVINAESSGSL
jgi:hypothetical protein